MVLSRPHLAGSCDPGVRARTLATPLLYERAAHARDAQYPL
jgi:hypothetical protein